METTTRIALESWLAPDKVQQFGGIKVPFSVISGRIMSAVVRDVHEGSLGNIWRDEQDPDNWMTVAQVGEYEGQPMVVVKLGDEWSVIIFNVYMAALAFALFVETLVDGALVRVKSIAAKISSENRIDGLARKILSDCGLELPDDDLDYPRRKMLLDAAGWLAVVAQDIDKDHDVMEHIETIVSSFAD